MSKQDPSNRPDSVSAFDPGRLAVLLAKAQELRDSGEDDFVQQVLDSMSDAERKIYGKILSDEITESLEASLQTEIPTDLGSEPETIDLSGIPDSSDVHAAATEVPSGSAKRSRDDDRPSSRRGAGATDRGDVRMPDRIGKFAIRRELGRGAFGVVYLGYDEELQREVAVKVSLVSDPQLQERLRVEGAKLAQVESPGIIPVYHIGRTENDKFYIVQKYIEGTTLRHVLRDQSLSPLVAVALMREIAVGLAPAHKIDILHRDLKPDNILIEEGGKAWVADFGLAISENEQVDHRRELAGTPPYMSPEQIKGRIDFLDPRSDIWSLGVMFYELLTGKLPFTGRDRKSLTEQICEMDPRPLHQRAPGLLTESMNEVFLRCCAKKPADRFATVDEFVDALDDLADEGLSDQNIKGETALSLGGVSTDQNRFLSTSSQRTAQGSTRLGSTRLGSTRLGSTRIGSTGLVGTGRSVETYRSEGSVPLTSNRSLMLAVAAAALCLSALALVGYQYHLRHSGDTPVVQASPSQVLKSGGSAAELKSITAQELLESGDGSLNGDGSKERPWIVGPGDGATHQTIADAVRGASAGDFIRVEPGTYEQPLLITKPITITGQRPAVDGEHSCIITGEKESPITVDCAEGPVRIEHFEIHGNGDDRKEKFNTIELRMGKLFIVSCKLEAETWNCIKVRGSGNLDVEHCEFPKSDGESISAMDSSEITVRHSRFARTGVEVTGGAKGEITGCTFGGVNGIRVAQHGAHVMCDGCIFDNNDERALSSLDGGQLEVTDAKIRGSNTGVYVGTDSMREAPLIAGQPASVILSESQLEDCKVALKVVGGTLTVSQNCLIKGSKKDGVAVEGGTADLSDVIISDSNEHALNVLNGAATMRRCTISETGLSAIRIDEGSVSFGERGVIEGFSVCGVEVGKHPKAARPEIQLDLHDVSIRSSGATVYGLVAYRGKIELNSVIIEGVHYGIFLGATLPGDDHGLAGNDKSADQRMVQLTAKETRFKDLTSFGLVGRGDSMATIDSATLDSLNESTGLQFKVPASITVIEQEP